VYAEFADAVQPGGGGADDVTRLRHLDGWLGESTGFSPERGLPTGSSPPCFWVLAKSADGERTVVVHHIVDRP
jgi:hypothetical protein